MCTCHVCVVDGVFEEVAGEGNADAAARASTPGIVFHPARTINAAAVAQVQANLRRRILRAYVSRGLLERSSKPVPGRDTAAHAVEWPIRGQ